MVEVAQADREGFQERFTTRELVILEYRSLLGLPKSPELPSILELPDSFFVPREFLGNIEEAVKKSQVGDREFSQRIDWISKVQVGRLLKGRKSSSPIEFKDTDSALFYYHTHGSGLGFSKRDVAITLVWPVGLMSSTVRLFGGLDFGVDVMLRSRESERWRGGLIRGLRKKNLIERELKKSDFAFPDDSMQAEILANYGLGYYRALGEKQWNQQVISAKTLSLDGGLKFVRVVGGNYE